MLPPCKDSLYKHAQRANYQAAIWRRSLSNEEIQNPIGHGWLLNESNEIEIEWMHGEPAPKAVLDLLSCKCKKACDEKCECKINKLYCTDMCRLQDCSNQKKVAEDEEFFDVDMSDISDEEEL